MTAMDQADGKSLRQESLLAVGHAHDEKLTTSATGFENTADPKASVKQWVRASRNC